VWEFNNFCIMALSPYKMKEILVLSKLDIFLTRFYLTLSTSWWPYICHQFSIKDPVLSPHVLFVYELCLSLYKNYFSKQQRLGFKMQANCVLCWTGTGLFMYNLDILFNNILLSIKAQPISIQIEGPCRQQTYYRIWNCISLLTDSKWISNWPHVWIK
jgi:hypothetical protein